MKIKAIQTITQETVLELRKLSEGRQYSYALVAPNGETVGVLREHKHSSIFEKKMTDNAYNIFGTIYIIDGKVVVD
jgi:hypothetical protein